MNAKNLLKRGQQGAALIISLILLVVITLMATTGMVNSTFELNMAGNTQYLNNAFQGAESIIQAELQRNDIVPLNAPGPLDDVAGNIDQNYQNGDAETQSTATGRTNYTQQALAPGWDVGGDFSAYHFEVLGDAVAQKGARAQHRQGFYVVGPSIN